MHPSTDTSNKVKQGKSRDTARPFLQGRLSAYVLLFALVCVQSKFLIVFAQLCVNVLCVEVCCIIHPLREGGTSTKCKCTIITG